jgi:hypothetical protein
MPRPISASSLDVAYALRSSRTIAQALTPTVTGWVMQSIALGASFVLGGGLKIV